METLGKYSDGLTSALKELEKELKKNAEAFQDAEVKAASYERAMGDAAESTKRQADLTKKLNLASNAASLAMNFTMMAGSLKDMTEALEEFNEGSIGTGELFDSLAVDIPMMGMMAVMFASDIASIGEAIGGLSGLKDVLKGILGALKRFSPYLLAIGAAVAVT